MLYISGWDFWYLHQSSANFFYRIVLQIIRALLTLKFKCASKYSNYSAHISDCVKKLVLICSMCVLKNPVSFIVSMLLVVCLMFIWYMNGVLGSRSIDHPNVIEGYGTIGLEILDQTENLDAVLIPVGGGALITGIATVIKKLKPEILVYVS